MECKKKADKAIKILKSLNGLGRAFIMLSESDKKAIAQLPEEKNVINRGVREALSREITIAFSHNEKFRPPPCAIVLLSCNGKIVGEMTDAGPKYYGGARDFEGRESSKASSGATAERDDFEGRESLNHVTDRGKLFSKAEKASSAAQAKRDDFDTHILPAVPFPELDGAFIDVCSASPGYVADKFLRTLIEAEEGDATLLVGFNLKKVF